MGVDVNEAGNRIAQLISQPEQPSDSAPQAESETLDEAQSPEMDTAGSEPEQLQESEAEETQEGETPESDTVSEEPTYTVNPGGEERQVTLDELRKGYMMEADYRKKTSEVARNRDEANQKLAELSEKITQADSILKIEVDDLNSESNLELKDLDPTAYYEKRDKIEAKAKQLQDARQKLNDEAGVQHQEFIKKEQERVFQAIPEWLDSEVMKKDADSINGLLNSLNFTDKEVAGLNDHRHYVILRKAAMYDQLKNANPGEKKIQPKPKVAKAGTTSTPEQRKADRDSSIRSKVTKTGKMRDAAAAIKQIMR